MTASPLHHNIHHTPHPHTNSRRRSFWPTRFRYYSLLYFCETRDPRANHTGCGERNQLVDPILTLLFSIDQTEIGLPGWVIMQQISLFLGNKARNDVFLTQLYDIDCSCESKMATSNVGRWSWSQNTVLVQLACSQKKKNWSVQPLPTRQPGVGSRLEAQDT